MREYAWDGIIGTFAAWVVLAAGTFLLWGCPSYNVWMKAKAGEAELAQASYNRKIKAKYLERRMPSD